MLGFACHRFLTHLLFLPSPSYIGFMMETMGKSRAYKSLQCPLPLATRAELI